MARQGDPLANPNAQTDRKLAYWDTAAVNAYPWTLACWFKCIRDNRRGVPLSIGSKSTSEGETYTHLDHSTTNLASSGIPLNAYVGRTRSLTPNAFVAVDSGADSYDETDDWHHLVFIEQGTSRELFIDGISVDTDSTSHTHEGLFDRTALFALARDYTTAARQWSANAIVSRPAIWDVVLSAPDIALLANGGWPLRCSDQPVFFVPTLYPSIRLDDIVTLGAPDVIVGDPLDIVPDLSQLDSPPYIGESFDSALGTDVTSLTISNVITQIGDTLAVVVHTYDLAEADATITAVTRDGVTLDLKIAQFLLPTIGGSTQIFYTRTPTIGTSDVTINFNGTVSAARATAHAVVGGGLIDAVVGATASNTANPTLSITANVPNCLLVGGLTTFGSETSDATPDSPNEELYEFSDLNTNKKAMGLSQDCETTGSKTMAATFTSGDATEDSTLAAILIAPYTTPTRLSDLIGERRGRELIISGDVDLHIGVGGNVPIILPKGDKLTLPIRSTKNLFVEPSDYANILVI